MSLQGPFGLPCFQTCLPPHRRFWSPALCGQWNAMWHRDPTKWDLVQRVRSPQPRVKGQDAAFHSFKARRMMSAASRLQLSGMKSWGWGMGERCRWREEPVWKDRGGDCEEAEGWRREKARKGIEPERGAGAVSPVRDPGPPASGSGSSAPAASPGMAWTCAYRYPCLSVPLSVNALGVASTATAPLLGGGRK